MGFNCETKKVCKVYLWFEARLTFPLVESLTKGIKCLQENSLYKKNTFNQKKTTVFYFSTLIHKSWKKVGFVGNTSSAYKVGTGFSS